MSEAMRVFACERAPNDKAGWVRLPRGVAYDVRLNGELVRHVVAADSIDGELWRYCDSKISSSPYWDQEKLTGRIEITRAGEPCGIRMRD